MKRTLLLFTIYLFSGSLIFAQQDQAISLDIAFYNFENLFDTLNHPEKNDEEFTPKGDLLYTQEIYDDKLKKLATVVSQIGNSGRAPTLLGVAEVENREVLEDFAAQPLVKHRNYQIIHFESPDFRGIDVAFLYDPAYFVPTDAKNYAPAILKDDGSPYVTRDILWVTGKLCGVPVHVLVNHWPSRRGGQLATNPKREAAATINRRIVDSLYQADGNPNIIIMGDFNDDPYDKSLKLVLQARKKMKDCINNSLYNPMWEMFDEGLGTLAYQDAWNVFDQIIVSCPIVEGKNGIKYEDAHIFQRSFMTRKSGRYKGYPHRSFAGGRYLGGYSDHFPVYVTVSITAGSSQ